MGKICGPLPVKLVIGMFSKEASVCERALKILEKKFAKKDFASSFLDFRQTDYYEKEMGTDLKRRFVSFARLINAKQLPKIKCYTNSVENTFSLGHSRRLINIDPGYVTLSKLVLATTKNFAHRIYVGDGIFEEITLTYKNKSFVPNPWTYPDYKSEDYIKIFNSIREKYRNQLESRYGLSQLYRCV